MAVLFKNLFSLLFAELARWGRVCGVPIGTGKRELFVTLLPAINLLALAMQHWPVETNDFLRLRRPQLSLILLVPVVVIIVATWDDWYIAHASRLIAQHPRFRVLGVVLAIAYCLSSVLCLYWAGRSFPLAPPSPK